MKETSQSVVMIVEAKVFELVGKAPKCVVIKTDCKPQDVEMSLLFDNAFCRTSVPVYALQNVRAAWRG
jgi:hypothetical protein